MTMTSAPKPSWRGACRKTTTPPNDGDAENDGEDHGRKQHTQSPTLHRLKPGRCFHQPNRGPREIDCKQWSQTQQDDDQIADALLTFDNGQCTFGL